MHQRRDVLDEMNHRAMNGEMGFYNYHPAVSMNSAQAAGNRSPVSADEEDTGLNGGEIAGIVIGSVVGALLLCLLARFIFMRNNSKPHGRQMEMGGFDQTGGPGYPGGYPSPHPQQLPNRTDVSIYDHQSDATGNFGETPDIMNVSGKGNSQRQSPMRKQN